MWLWMSTFFQLFMYLSYICYTPNTKLKQEYNMGLKQKFQNMRTVKHSHDNVLRQMESLNMQIKQEENRVLSLQNELKLGMANNRKLIEVTSLLIYYNQYSVGFTCFTIWVKVLGASSARLRFEPSKVFISQMLYCHQTCDSIQKHCFCRGLSWERLTRRASGWDCPNDQTVIYMLHWDTVWMEGRLFFSNC